MMSMRILSQSDLWRRRASRVITLTYRKNDVGASLGGLVLHSKLMTWLVRNHTMQLIQQITIIVL